MKYLKLILFIFLFILVLFFSCNGNGNLLLEENAKIFFYIRWPTKIILDETTDIAVFISNNNIKNYKKSILINREQGNQAVNWSLYPGEYTITVLAMKFLSNTSSGLRNFSILTGDVKIISLNPNENKDLSVELGYLNITANLAFNDGEMFYITTPIPIKFDIDYFCSVLKFSGGKLYFTYNNGFTNITEYQTIYVGNTEELGNGYFLSIVYPDSEGYPSNSFDLSIYAKFTVSSDKIATDFMSFYQINEIKIEISDYSLGHLEDGTPCGSLNIIIQ